MKNRSELCLSNPAFLAAKGRRGFRAGLDRLPAAIHFINPLQEIYETRFAEKRV